MEHSFKENDIVRIKSDEYAKDIVWEENAFAIAKITGNDVILSEYVRIVPMDAIEPVPIDGIADTCIYYDPDIAADIIAPGTTCTDRSRDYTYYMKSFSKTNVDGISLRESYDRYGFKYVHEVQHWLKEEYCDNGLKIRHTIRMLH